MDTKTAAPTRGRLTPRLAKIVSRYVHEDDRSQGQIAARADVSINTLSRRLNGHRPFTIDELDTIAGLLGTQVSVLVAEAERQPFIPTQRQHKES